MASTSADRRIVVVGASLAGVTLVDDLRRGGFSGSVTLIGAEPRTAYNRPALSKGIVDATATADDIMLPQLACAVDEIIGTAAASLDLINKAVVLDNGDSVPFDQVAITTGARARLLADFGAAEPGAREITLRGLDDAEYIARALQRRPHVVIVGAGILGMEMASACVDRGATVVVVDRQPPLLRQLGPYLSGIVTRAAQTRGVTVVQHPAGVRLRGSSAPVVELADGRRLEGDLVLTAVGCTPNVEWLAGTGLLIDSALRIDARCRVTPAVVAAGDVAAFPTDKGFHRTPTWNSALEQARTAARTLMEGDDALALTPAPYFWTEQFGLRIRICGGLPVADAPTILEGDSPADGMLLTWPNDRGGTTAAAINKRIPVTRLRALAQPVHSMMEVPQ